MSPALPGTSTTTDRRAGFRLRFVGLVRSEPARSGLTGRRGARAAVGWFVALVLLAHLVALAALDAPWPNLRDPEYGLRAPRLRARVAEHPNRPLVLVVGSSRACMGVKPDAWEAVRPGAPDDPVLFNFSTVGAGPVQQLITVQRLYRDGFRPAVVLLEYWPALLRQDGPFAEQYRVGRRLRLDDRAVVRDYFPDPDRAEREMLTARANPLYANRDRWVALAFPKVLSANRHADLAWRELDRWGWLPGLDVRPDDRATRELFLTHYRDDYRKQFDGHTIHPDSDRALREAVALVRATGARVGFLYLPEASEFRGWYPPHVEASAREHFAGLVRALNVPALDARTWMADELLADGHHLSRTGAGAFTERLGSAVGTAFPHTHGGAP